MDLLMAMLGAGSGGGFLSVGAAANAGLRRVLRSPVAAAAVNFSVGFLMLTLLLLLGIFGPQSFEGLGQVPWWAFGGGALGAMYVTVNTLAVARLGLTTTTLAVVCSQMVLSLVIDRGGWFGLEPQPLRPVRVVAIGLLLVAIALTQLDRDRGSPAAPLASGSDAGDGRRVRRSPAVQGLRIGARIRGAKGRRGLGFGAEPSPPPLWIGVAISFYAFIAIGIAEAGLGILLPSILTAYGLTPGTVTLLFLSQVGGYITAALTSSLVTARLGLGRSLLVAASLLTGALLIYGLSPVWPLMVLAGPLMGLGIGLIDAGINTALVQEERTAHLLGALHGFYGLGAVAGPAIATTLLALGLNWRQVYGVLAGLTGLLVVAVLAAVVGRYGPLRKRPADPGAPAAAVLGQALRRPVVLLFGAFLLIYVGLEASFSHWAYGVQVMARSTPPTLAGYGVSAYWLGLTAGRFLLGYGLRSLGALRVLSFSLGLLLAGLLAWWQWPDARIGALVSLPLIGFALAAIFPTIIWLIPQRVPAALVPAAVGFATSAASVGAALIPTAVGWAANGLGLGMVPVLMLPLAIAMVGLHWRLRGG